MRLKLAGFLHALLAGMLAACKTIRDVEELTEELDIRDTDDKAEALPDAVIPHRFAAIFCAALLFAVLDAACESDSTSGGASDIADSTDQGSDAATAQGYPSRARRRPTRSPFRTRKAAR